MKATVFCPYCVGENHARVGAKSVAIAANTMGHQLKIFVICVQCSRKFTHVIELRLAAIGLPQKVKANEDADQLSI